MRHATLGPHDALEGYSLMDTAVVAAGLVGAVLLGMVAVSNGTAAFAIVGGLVVARLLGVDSHRGVRATGALTRRLRIEADRAADTAAAYVVTR